MGTHHALLLFDPPVQAIAVGVIHLIARIEKEEDSAVLDERLQVGGIGPRQGGERLLLVLTQVGFDWMLERLAMDVGRRRGAKRGGEM